MAQAIAFPSFCHRLGVFLNRYMQRISWRENLLCRNQAFDFWRGYGFERRFIASQTAKDLIGYALDVTFVREVLEDTPSARIVSQLKIRHASAA